MDPETINQPPPPPPPPKHRPAITLTVESWATPLVGVIMLVTGLVAGYFGRPLISKPVQTAEPIVQNPTSPQQEVQIPERIDAQAVDQIVTDTRHFKGSADAPITLIEFSDFQ